MQVELASGLGLIRDAVTIANDASASLSQKVALFGASAVMTPQDRERLEGLLGAVERQQGRSQAAPLAAEVTSDLDPQPDETRAAAEHRGLEAAARPFAVATH